MIQVFKIVKGFDELELDSFFGFANGGLRTWSFTQTVQHSFKSSSGKFSFFDRRVSDWNSLPQHVISSELCQDRINETSGACAFYIKQEVERVLAMMSHCPTVCSQCIANLSST